MLHYILLHCRTILILCNKCQRCKPNIALLSKQTTRAISWAQLQPQFDMAETGNYETDSSSVGRFYYAANIVVYRKDGNICRRNIYACAHAFQLCIAPSSNNE